jgi:hypothetical protein
MVTPIMTKRQDPVKSQRFEKGNSLRTVLRSGNGQECASGRGDVPTHNYPLARMKNNQIQGGMRAPSMTPNKTQTPVPSPESAVDTLPQAVLFGACCSGQCAYLPLLIVYRHVAQRIDKLPTLLAEQRWMSPALITFTRDHWSRRYGYPLLYFEAIHILDNVRVFAFAVVPLILQEKS